MADEKHKIKVLILTEDSYGVPFWKKVMSKLKDNSLIPKKLKLL